VHNRRPNFGGDQLPHVALLTAPRAGESPRTPPHREIVAVGIKMPEPFDDYPILALNWKTWGSLSTACAACQDSNGHAATKVWTEKHASI